MKHFAAPVFWEQYQKLPSQVKELANKNFELLKQDRNHPSLHFKQIQNYYSVRVGLRYRALGISIT